MHEHVGVTSWSSKAARKRDKKARLRDAKAHAKEGAEQVAVAVAEEEAAWNATVTLGTAQIEHVAHIRSDIAELWQ